MVEMSLGMIGEEQLNDLGRGVCGDPEQRGDSHGEEGMSRGSE